VDACLKQGIKVNGLPGPSSITMGLSLTGFPADRFLFEGYFNFKINISRFLPKK
jgi:16S rRNA C1402 (ribose-2'-O) methylase RsmI